MLEESISSPIWVIYNLFKSMGCREHKIVLFNKMSPRVLEVILRGLASWWAQFDDIKDSKLDLWSLRSRSEKQKLNSPGCLKCECGSSDDFPTPTLLKAFELYPVNKNKEILLWICDQTKRLIFMIWQKNIYFHTLPYPKTLFYVNNHILSYMYFFPIFY